MAGKWTGGIAASAIDDEPPTVEEWIPVSVPGRPTAFADVDDPIVYRTTFSDPRGHAGERTRISLHGTYGRARVWINGTYLGERDPYFVPARIEFDAQEENELLVCCERPTTGGGIYETGDVSRDLAVPGIWWRVELQVRPGTFIDSLSATPRLTDEGAVIDATVEIDAGAAIDDAVTLSLRPEGFRGGGSMERARVDADAGECVTVSKELEVRDPRRWWPRGYGPQHRYTVRAKLGEDDLERTVGLRTVDRDEDGLLVNGRRIRAHGVGRLPSEAAHEDVRRAVDANATLIRVRGHVPSPAFYAACDEAGLLVWQDLPIRGDDFDPERAEALLESIEETYGSHPSLAMYGVRTVSSDSLSNPSSGGLLSKLSFRWRAWRAGVDRTGADAVAQAAPDERAVVPVSGPPGIDPDAMHVSPGWRYLEATDVDWLLDRYPASVIGSFGAGSVTESIDSVPGIDPDVLEGHTTDPETSRTQQAATVKTVGETLRRRGCEIVVAATLRDGAPGGGTGVLGSDGTAKPAYEALSSAYEPVQVVLDEQPAPGRGPIGITLCNDTEDPVESTVRWLAGETVGETDVSVDPGARESAGTVDVPADATGITLECTVRNRTITNEYLL